LNACIVEHRPAVANGDEPIVIRTCSTGGDNYKEHYTEWDQSFESFDSMDLKENLLRGIYAYGESPSRLASHAAARRGFSLRAKFADLFSHKRLFPPRATSRSSA
jgi:hypothetical protein